MDIVLDADHEDYQDLIGHKYTQTLKTVTLKIHAKGTAHKPALRASITQCVIEFREKTGHEKINEFIPSYSVASQNFKLNQFHYHGQCQ